MRYNVARVSAPMPLVVVATIILWYILEEVSLLAQ